MLITLSEGLCPGKEPCNSHPVPRSRDWPVLTRPRLAGFEVSTEDPHIDGFEVFVNILTSSRDGTPVQGCSASFVGTGYAALADTCAQKIKTCHDLVDAIQSEPTP